MEYRRLGKSGLQVSEFSFGSWVMFLEPEFFDGAVECLKIAYEAGINFFDNAESYSKGESEKRMGAAIKKLGWSRSSYCVSSKAFFGSGEYRPTQRGLSRKHLHDACHAALKRLQVDYLDLFFCHRPDANTPIEETVRATNDLIRQGKVLYWGTSEWSAQQIMEAHMVARALGLQGPTMEQPKYNMLHRDRVEKEYSQIYKDIGLGLTIWSPLASGVLTNKYARGVPERSRATLPSYKWFQQWLLSEEGEKSIQMAIALNEVAADLGMPLAQMALLWCLQNPHVSTAILGASRPEQLRDNLAALEKKEKMTPEVMERIEAILGNKPIPFEEF